MEKNSSKMTETKETGKKDGNYQLELLISTMLAIFLFVLDMIILINYPSLLAVNIVVTILVLIAVFVVFDAIFKIMKQKKEYQEEYFESLAIAQKANYLLMKKTYDDLSSLVKNIKVEDHADEIISAQKAIAKITIGREKENAEAIMNSNDNVIDQMMQMQEKLIATENAILAGQKGISEDDISGNEKLFKEINEIEASMKDGLNEISITLSGFQEEIERLADSMASIISGNTLTGMSSEKASFVEEPVMEESFVEDSSSDILEEEFVAEPEIESEVAELMEEEPQETVVLDENLLFEAAKDEELKLEDILSVDDIVNSISDGVGLDEMAEEIDMGLETEEVMADNDISMDLENDISLDEDINLDSDISLDNDFIIGEDTSLDDILKMAEDSEIEEAISAANAMPNKIMTPEEIEALLAGAAEAETVQDKPVENPIEESPAMPDLSDPGKIMTPEEIAAMLANM